jgi:hypothetical protein
VSALKARPASSAELFRFILYSSSRISIQLSLPEHEAGGGAGTSGPVYNLIESRRISMKPEVV